MKPKENLDSQEKESLAKLRHSGLRASPIDTRDFEWTPRMPDFEICLLDRRMSVEQFERCCEYAIATGNHAA